MSVTKRVRPGFTLLELLVVIAIIGILSSMTAVAIFRLRASSMETRTNETLEKLHRAYEAQLKAATTSINKEQLPDATLFWAGQKEDLARAIHLKLRLRQEFPRNSSDLAILTSISGVPAIDNGSGTKQGLISLYSPKKYYTSQLALAGSAPLDNNANAALFYMALSQSRGGASFDPEQIGAIALGKKFVGPTEYKVFIDGFGEPVIYAVQLPGEADGSKPSAHPVLVELNQSPYVSAKTAAGKRDPLDPTGSLTAWANRDRLDAVLLGTTFPITPASLPRLSDGFNRGPVVFSAGADKTFGTGDDLFSFRLLSTGKAN